MKKAILGVILTSILLSAAGCNSKTQKVTHKTPDTSDIGIIASRRETENTQSETTESEIKDDRIINLTQRPKNQYDINVKFNEESNSADVEQKLSYVNNTGSELNEIYFNLIPNAFSKKEGGIEVDKISIGTDVLKMEQVKETVYRLSLPSPLANGKVVTIDMKYSVKIPLIADRFGFYNNTYNFGNVLITPALFENGEWLVQPYVDIGDAFYTEISDYRVSIDVPDGYLVASTGTRIDNVYVAENVRDFAFTITKDLDLLCEEYEDIALNVFYPKNCPGTGKHVMEVARKSLSLFNEMLGKYPYDTLNMVLCGMPGGIGGMEYPGLIMMTVDEDITESLFDLYNGKITVKEYLEKTGDNTDVPSGEPSEPVPEDVIKNTVLYSVNSLTKSTAHEIGHQWFYGIVGNDEVRYPWIDEGFCRFMEAYYENTYHDGANDDFSLFDLLSNMDQSIYNEYKGISDGEVKSVNLNESLYDFMKHKEEYGEIYYKGAAMIYHMYREMGDEAFRAAVKEYISTFAYTEVTPDEFREFWSKKGDFAEMFDVYLKKSE
ncbi:MAG: M1 family metallopeptidase [Saccharofermentanaceae bacterium]|nr:M1 family metallopeptidase [Saccharofermentanaceae bacterium]